MPFTFAHPAAVIPLNRKFNKHLDFTALVLGSMAPDFEYFLWAKPLATIGHRWDGFIIINLPICLLLAYLFHCLVKKPMLTCLPSSLSKYMMPVINQAWSLKSFKALIVFMYSSILGMCTHVLWDGFTHKTGYFVERFSFLLREVSVLEFKIPIYKLAQHTSTVVGLSIIIYILYNESKKIKETPPLVDRHIKWLYYLLAIAVGIGLLGLKLFYTLALQETLYLGELVIVVINSGLLGVLLSSVWISLHPQYKKHFGY